MAASYSDRARARAGPELNEEHGDIIVGHPYGKLLLKFLQEHNIAGHVEELFCDFVILGGNPKYDEVQQLIDEWLEGPDFRLPGAK